MWRTSRLSISALDDLLQRGFAEYEPTGGKRLVERKRPTKDRESLRFPLALAHGFALRHRARHRRTAHQPAGTNRQTAQLFSAKGTAPHGGAHARLRRPHPQYLSSDSAYHGALGKVICPEHH